jgi:NAD(P)-dependent dehydrogenase (short-subunit alcohol dehydrogenase family)
VLLTGCSSGIGRATALRLVREGHVVYATALPHRAGDRVVGGSFPRPGASDG